MRQKSLTAPQGLTDRLAEIVESEFREMSGLRLNEGEAKRLWDLTDDQCARYSGG